MRRRTTFALLGALLLLASASLAPRSQAQMPPHSRAYGHSLAEWMEIYVRAAFAGGPDTVGNVRMMPIPNGDYVGGSFTPDDPGVFVGHRDVTLKTGQPFVLPIAFWYGESYLPDAGVPNNPDPVMPKSFFDPCTVKVAIDGKTIIDGDKEDKFKYYVGPIVLDPKIVYPQPSSYGSISADWIQGFVFVHQPLSKGTHTMTLESSLFIPGGGVYANVPNGIGQRFLNTWTITVE